MSIKLTEEQTKFLNANSIPLSRILDASNLAPKIYKILMKELDKDLSTGVTICKRLHDTMRTRSGHCVFCNPEALLHQARFYKNAYVYIAISPTQKISKIGFSEDTDDREKRLNYQGYGGINDWIIVYKFHCKNAGRAEFEAQNILSKYAYPTSFIKDGVLIDCKETFKCNPSLAIKAFLELVPNNERKDEWTHTEIMRFNFENVENDNFVRTPVKNETTKSQVRTTRFLNETSKDLCENTSKQSTKGATELMPPVGAVHSTKNNTAWDDLFAILGQTRDENIDAKTNDAKIRQSTDNQKLTDNVQALLDKALAPPNMRATTLHSNTNAKIYKGSTRHQQALNKSLEFLRLIRTTIRNIFVK